MARPTKYSKEMVDQAYEYIDTYGEHGDMIPSIETDFKVHVEIP